MAEKIPLHVAIIMDGNRRWARERRLPVFKGHREGAETLMKIAKYAKKRGIKVLTVFAFSLENWQRSSKEVRYLMKLFEKVLTKRVEELHKNRIQLRISGRIGELPQNLQQAIKRALDLTQNNNEAILNIALNYGGRAELIDAFERLLEKGLKPGDLNEEVVDENLYTTGLPDPDIIIRTAGEMRLSGFLPWQGVYAELFFVEKFWPDFEEEDLDKIIREYQKRERRFGR